MIGVVVRELAAAEACGGCVMTASVLDREGDRIGDAGVAIKSRQRTVHSWLGLLWRLLRVKCGSSSSGGGRPASQRAVKWKAPSSPRHDVIGSPHPNNPRTLCLIVADPHLKCCRWFVLTCHITACTRGHHYLPMYVPIYL